MSPNSQVLIKAWLSALWEEVGTSRMKLSHWAHFLDEIGIPVFPLSVFLSQIKQVGFFLFVFLLPSVFATLCCQAQSDEAN